MPVHLTVYRNGLVSRSDYDEIYAWSGRFTGTDYYTSDILGSVMMTTDSLGHVTNRYSYDAYGTAYNGSFGGRNKIGYNGKKYDNGTGWYNYGYRDYNPQQGRFTTQDPIRDGMNWYAYCGGDPINCIDLWGLKKLNMPGVPTNIQQILQKKHDKENTKIEVVRNPEKKDSNDVIRIYIDNEVIATYKCQSEKNYRSGNQTRAQSWEDDVTNRNVTLPCSDDYKIIMMEESPSYIKPFKIVSDSVLINGKDINNDCFMIHSWDQKEKQIEVLIAGDVKY